MLTLTPKRLAMSRSSFAVPCFPGCRIHGAPKRRISRTSSSVSFAWPKSLSRFFLTMSRVLSLSVPSNRCDGRTHAFTSHLWQQFGSGHLPVSRNHATRCAPSQ